MKRKKKRRRESYREDPPRPDYGDATPEDVARALLLYRPDQKTVIKAQEPDNKTQTDKRKNQSDGYRKARGPSVSSGKG